MFGDNKMQLASGRIFELIVLFLIWGSGTYFLFTKREVWMRRLPALDFIDEAVGRAAEMGRPVTVHGFGDYDAGIESPYAPQIMAGLAVLGHAAKICARHGTMIMATMRAGTVVPLAEETLRTAYRLEGKQDVFEAQKEEMLPWTASRQSMVALGFRTRPAANIMIGPFWSETIQIAEVYGRLGAVQIGGTGSLTQMPFLAACMDMTLIGEEIYAVGAYIDERPATRGSIAVVDIFKILSMIFIIVGMILATIGNYSLLELFSW